MTEWKVEFNINFHSFQCSVCNSFKCCCYINICGDFGGGELKRGGKERGFA